MTTALFGSQVWIDFVQKGLVIKTTADIKEEP
jgi:hypothetical protein